MVIWYLGALLGRAWDALRLAEAMGCVRGQALPRSNGFGMSYREEGRVGARCAVENRTPTVS